jgi:hypothetical protein
MTDNACLCTCACREQDKAWHMLAHDHVTCCIHLALKRAISCTIHIFTLHYKKGTILYNGYLLRYKLFKYAPKHAHAYANQ